MWAPQAADETQLSVYPTKGQQRYQVESKDQHAWRKTEPSVAAWQHQHLSQKLQPSQRRLKVVQLHRQPCRTPANQIQTCRPHHTIVLGPHAQKTPKCQLYRLVNSKPGQLRKSNTCHGNSRNASKESAGSCIKRNCRGSVPRRSGCAAGGNGHWGQLGAWGWAVY